MSIATVALAQGAPGGASSRLPELPKDLWATYDATPRVAQDIELTIGVVELERDGAGGFGAGAPDLGELELDAIGDVNPDTVLVTCCRAHDRSPARLEHALDGDPCPPTLDIHLELNRREDRLLDAARHGAEHPPMRPGLLGLATVQHGGQSITLPLVGARVDDGLHGAVALVDGAGPCIEQGGPQALQRHVTEMTLVDPDHLEAVAVAAGGPTLELARAAIVTVAAAERDPFEIPIDHPCLPSDLGWHHHLRGQRSSSSHP